MIQSTAKSKIEFSVHLVAKYSLAKQHESVQHWTNANVDGVLCMWLEVKKVTSKI